MSVHVGVVAAELGNVRKQHGYPHDLAVVVQVHLVKSRWPVAGRGGGVHVVLQLCHLCNDRFRPLSHRHRRRGQQALLQVRQAAGSYRAEERVAGQLGSAHALARIHSQRIV